MTCLLKTPKFWYPQHGGVPLLAHMLTPISVLYQLGHRINQACQTPRRAPLPVICVGNITAGGSGKTPVCLALAHILKKDKNPFFLTRGYGGADARTRVISVHDAPSETGDEPLLLAQCAQTVISHGRHDGACLAHEAGAGCVIMDDGLLNGSVHKDISILVIDGAAGLGNGKTLPAGPLRTPLKDILPQIDHVVIIGEDQHNIAALINEQVDISYAFVDVADHTLNQDLNYIAFAGIALPQKFQKTLKDHGFNISAFHAFADHHPYSEAELERLMDEAQSRGAALITTHKDYVRLPDRYKEYISYLPITVKWHDEGKLTSFLREALP